MLCARVMRGINSMARKLTPRSASARAASTAVSGSPKPMTAWLRRNSARSAAPVSGLAPGPRTCKITPAEPNTSWRFARRAPFSAYSASGKPARVPAPASTTTSTPDLPRTENAPGTIATRRSPGDASETTPTVIPTPCSPEFSCYWSERASARLRRASPSIRTRAGKEVTPCSSVP